MPKLIVLSNRVTLPQPGSTQAGGLAVALEDALHGVGGIWMGWNGQKNNHKQHKFDIHQYGTIEYQTCHFSEQEYQGFYCGFANGALWPLMHNQPHYIDYLEQDYKTYQDVNYKFAKQLQKTAAADDLIWIHDYHFLSVAHYCRQLGMKNRIGFFLHIPFPATTQWNALKQANDLAQHISAYDLFGVQTQQDQNHCYAFLQQRLHATAYTKHILHISKHSIEIRAYPISVHPTAIQRRAEKIALTSPSIPFQIDKHKKQIISVDRIDYSKGLLEKIEAMRHVFNLQPALKTQLQQWQIACPCRLDVPVYAHLYQDFKEAVHQFNRDFQTEDAAVFECHYDAVKHQQLMQLYRQADICWVNSIQDGMNLVAKEFIAAQDPNDPGVLLLSQYTGAAEQMKQAVLFDPHDHRSVLKALQHALNMPLSERRARYQSLYQGLCAEDIVKWRNDYVRDLKGFLLHPADQLLKQPHKPQVYVQV